MNIYSLSVVYFDNDKDINYYLKNKMDFKHFYIDIQIQIVARHISIINKIIYITSQTYPL